MALGAEALLALSMQFDAVDATIEQMIATPKENTRRFKQKLAGLKRAKELSWAGLMKMVPRHSTQQ